MDRFGVTAAPQPYLSTKDFYLKHALAINNALYWHDNKQIGSYIINEFIVFAHRKGVWPLTSSSDAYTGSRGVQEDRDTLWWSLSFSSQLFPNLVHPLFWRCHERSKRMSMHTCLTRFSAVGEIYRQRGVTVMCRVRSSKYTDSIFQDSTEPSLECLCSSVQSKYPYRRICKLFRLSISSPASFPKLPTVLDTYWASYLSRLHKTHCRRYEFLTNDHISLKKSACSIHVFKIYIFHLKHLSVMNI